MPAYTVSELGALFEDQFSLAVFSKDGAFWPVLVGKIKDPTASGTPVTALLARMEDPAFGALKNLFLADPGNPDVAGFKAGKASTLATRYIQFELPGAAINYGADSAATYISTSYFGLLEVLKARQPVVPIAPPATASGTAPAAPPASTTTTP